MQILCINLDLFGFLQKILRLSLTEKILDYLQRQLT